jgi:hypothetical protein
MRPSIDMTMLVLSAVCVADEDGQPMTAGDIAFLLELPREETDCSLDELIADGSIRLDGDRYRRRRPPTKKQLALMEQLSDSIQPLCPSVGDIPVRLDS